MTPEGKIIEVNDDFIEHIEFAEQHGWLDDWKDDIKPDNNAGVFDNDPYFEWTMRMKKRLFDKGYVRSRFYKGGNSDDISIQGKEQNITSDVVQMLLNAYGKLKDYPITIEACDGRELLSKGTLSDWLRIYNRLYRG